MFRLNEVVKVYWVLICRELAKIEQDIREAEAEISKKKPMFIKAKEKVTHFQKKVVTYRVSDSFFYSKLNF